MIYTRFKKIIIKWLLLNSIIISVLPYSFVQASNQKGQYMPMENLIDSLLLVTGQEYLNKETLLRQGGNQAISALKARLHDKDTFTTFYANTIINWMEGRSPNNDAALLHLDRLPAKLAKTPIITPSPSGTAAYLNLHFQSSVTDILAVHLIKLPDLPYWRTAAVLLYLEEQKSQKVTDVLLRFISKTIDDDFKNIAIATIDKTNDPLLDAKILQEEIHLKSFNLNLPLPLKNRLSKP